MDLATARRHAVLSQFIRPYQSHEDIGGFDAKAMADRIVRLERIIHALREPSDPLIDKLCDLHEVETETERCFVIGIIRMAVAAAEREADA